MLQFRVLSVGTLAMNPLWGEKVPTREGHATTTLIEAGNRRIIVDPSLPANILQPRMQSRTPITCDAITDVFLTSRDPARFRGIALFPNAQWWMAEKDREVLAQVAAEVPWVSRIHDAPDSLAPGVDLFPLPGVTGGTTGLLLAFPSTTILITGDAIATQEHLDQGRIVSPCESVEAAQESFREAIEIGDGFILGRDNFVLNPLRGTIGVQPK